MKYIDNKILKNLGGNQAYVLGCLSCCLDKNNNIVNEENEYMTLKEMSEYVGLEYSELRQIVDLFIELNVMCKNTCGLPTKPNHITYYTISPKVARNDDIVVRKEHRKHFNFFSYEEDLTKEELDYFIPERNNACDDVIGYDWEANRNYELNNMI